MIVHPKIYASFGKEFADEGKCTRIPVEDDVRYTWEALQWPEAPIGLGTVVLQDYRTEGICYACNTGFGSGCCLQP